MRDDWDWETHHKLNVISSTLFGMIAITLAVAYGNIWLWLIVFYLFSNTIGWMLEGVEVY